MSETTKHPREAIDAMDAELALYWAKIDLWKWWENNGQPMPVRISSERHDGEFVVASNGERQIRNIPFDDIHELESAAWLAWADKLASRSEKLLASSKSVRSRGLAVMREERARAERNRIDSRTTPSGRPR